MVHAVVLIQCEIDRIPEAAQAIAELEGVSEVYSVAGEFDLVAIIRVKDNESLAALVTDRMLQVDGITRSETLIAFRVFSRHDLEGMFAIGWREEAA